MAKAKKKVTGDAAGTPPTQAAQASQRDDSRQARRDLDDALRAAQAREAADAIRRASAWLGAIATLEELLGNRNWIEGRTTYRAWIDPQHARDYAKETGDSLEEARDWLAGVEELGLEATLEHAANRILLFESDLRWPISQTVRRIFGKRDLSDNAHLAVDDLGQTLKALRVLLKEDLAIAKPEPSEPQDPLTPEETGYLKLLHELDDGDKLSDDLAAKLIGYADPGSIVDLRKLLKDKGWKAIATKTGRGGGSSLDRSLLTPAQRERLDALTLANADTAFRPRRA